MEYVSSKFAYKFLKPIEKHKILRFYYFVHVRMKGSGVCWQYFYISPLNSRLIFEVTKDYIIFKEVS